MSRPGPRIDPQLADDMVSEESSDQAGVSGRMKHRRPAGDRVEDVMSICLSEILRHFGVFSIAVNHVRLDRDGERFGELTYEHAEDPDSEGFYFTVGATMGAASGATLGPRETAQDVLLLALARVGWLDLIQDAGEHREDNGATLGV